MAVDDDEELFGEVYTNRDEREQLTRYLDATLDLGELDAGYDAIRANIDDAFSDGDDEPEYMIEEDRTLEPIDTPHDPTAAGLPTDRGTTERERRQTFQDEYEDAVRDRIDLGYALEVASGLVDADQDRIRSELADDEQDGLPEGLTEEIISAAEQSYVRDHTFYRDDMDRLVDDVLEERLDDTLPTHEMRDGVWKRYDGADIDPRSIQRQLVQRLAADADELLSEHDPMADRLVDGQRLPPDAGPDALEEALPASLAAIESRPGEPGMGVRWDPDHPGVQESAAAAYLDSIGKEIQRAATGGAEAAPEELERLQDRYGASLERFRVEETLEELESEWGRADMPYTIYEIDDARELERAARDIGNCRTTATGYYQELADDPHTTVLGVRRDDHDEWIGMARAFHMETPDGADVFAIDNLGMQYEGDVAGDPENCCDFEAFGDALPVMGLASIAYGLERGFDMVVAGREDGRVGGGPGDRIGVAQLYSTTNADEDDLPVEKRGVRDIDRPYGLKHLSDPMETQGFAVLMEHPAMD